MAKTKLGAFVVFYGEEDYLLDREYQKSKAWPDRMVTFLEGTSTTCDEVLDALFQLSLDDSLGVAVVLDNAQKLKPTKAFKQYVEGREATDSSAVLVAIFRDSKVPKGWDFLAAKARCVEHRKFKAWETPKIQARVLSEARRCGLEIAGKAMDLILKIYGQDIKGIVNEFQKLSFIIPAGGNITPKHILSVCRAQLAVQPWDVAAYAAEKDLKQALTTTALLFKYEGENIALPILAALMRQTEQLLVVRSLLDQGQLAKEIAQTLQVHEFLVGKVFVPAAKKHKASDLLLQMKTLCKLETQVKGQASSKRTLVELAVHQLAA